MPIKTFRPNSVYNTYVNTNTPGRNNLSLGISELNTPQVYKAQVAWQMMNCHFFSHYTECAIPLMIKIYEKMIASDDATLSSRYANHVTLTPGAAGAIRIVFDYIAQTNPQAIVLMLGLNYYLFYSSCYKNNLKSYELTSDDDNRMYPNLDQIARSLDELHPSVLALSLPLNPSGEVYTHEEMTAICEMVKARNILLIIDKCQMDEFNPIGQYINLGKVISQCDYFDRTVIINSLSKTRAIPGLRQGYFLSGEDAFLFAKQYKQNSFYTVSNACATANLIDYSLRVVAYYDGRIDNERLLKNVRRTFSAAMRNSKEKDEIISVLVNILKDDTYPDSYLSYCNEMHAFWKTAYNNYHYSLDHLRKFTLDHIEMKGGYNYLIRLENPFATQRAFMDQLYQEENIVAFSCDMFSITEHKPKDPFWLRITTSIPENRFAETIQKFSCFLQRNYN